MVEEKGLGWSEWTAIYAAVVSTCSAVIEVWKWKMEGPKLSASIASGQRHQRLYDDPDSLYMRVTVSNQGSQVTTITRAELISYESAFFRWRNRPAQSGSLRIAGRRYSSATIKTISSGSPVPDRTSMCELPYQLEPGFQWEVDFKESEQVKELAKGKKLRLAVWHSFNPKKPFIERIELVD